MAAVMEEIYCVLGLESQTMPMEANQE